MSAKVPVRCALYTRKSTEEGLEQDFNSLDAQREAGEAYVLSQKAEGWIALSGFYDDGGYSGGTLERPALQRLIADIEAGKVDVVVVYKIDRLSRSLMDFAKLVEVFDRKNVTFVSVTQSFNTTTSMGRLTLNVLLSFAQFEREVTGERIRDKFAASKRKGMWMGGTPPFGYDIVSRKLLVNGSEAATVRLIFQRYIDLGSVRTLRDHLAARGVVSKIWTSTAGIAHGGKPFDRRGPGEELSEGENGFTLMLPVRARFQGGRASAVTAHGTPLPSSHPDSHLLTALARAHNWKALLAEGRIATIAALAVYAGQERRHVGRTLNLAFFAPDLALAILDGRQPSGLSLSDLLAGDIPRSWYAQRQWLSDLVGAKPFKKAEVVAPKIWPQKSTAA